MRKPVVGETLYKLNVGNAARHRPQSLTPAIVTRVGRKYFYLDYGSWAQDKVHIDTWHECTNYSSNFSLYESPQAWEDEKEMIALYGKIKPFFDAYHFNDELNIDQLKLIAGILAIKTE